MMDVLQGIGYGIVALAILVVVGLVVLTKLGDTVAQCASGFTYNSTAGARNCYNLTDTTDTADPANTAWVSQEYLSTQLGSTGLSGWVPAIIAVAIGALFLSYFMGRKKR
jgi:uncharacterized protein (DUF697 family)